MDAGLCGHALLVDTELSDNPNAADSILANGANFEARTHPGLFTRSVF